VANDGKTSDDKGVDNGKGPGSVANDGKTSDDKGVDNGKGPGSVANDGKAGDGKGNGGDGGEAGEAGCLEAEVRWLVCDRDVSRAVRYGNFVRLEPAVRVPIGAIVRHVPGPVPVKITHWAGRLPTATYEGAVAALKQRVAEDGERAVLQVLDRPDKPFTRPALHVGLDRRWNAMQQDILLRFLRRHWDALKARRLTPEPDDDLMGSDYAMLWSVADKLPTSARRWLHDTFNAWQHAYTSIPSFDWENAYRAFWAALNIIQT
jgi:hypothetical protein